MPLPENILNFIKMSVTIPSLVSSDSPGYAYKYCGTSTITDHLE